MAALGGLDEQRYRRVSMYVPTSSINLHTKIHNFYVAVSAPAVFVQPGFQVERKIEEGIKKISSHALYTSGKTILSKASTSKAIISFIVMPFHNRHMCFKKIDSVLSIKERFSNLPLDSTKVPAKPWFSA